MDTTLLIIILILFLVIAGIGYFTRSRRGISERLGGVPTMPPASAAPQDKEITPEREQAAKPPVLDDILLPPAAPPPPAMSPGAPPPPQSIPLPKPVSAEPPRQQEIGEGSDDDEAEELAEVADDMLMEDARGGAAMPEAEVTDEMLMDDLRGGAAMPEEESKSDEGTSDKRRDREEYIPHPSPSPSAPVIDPQAFGGSLPTVPITQMLEAAQEVEFSAYYPKEVVPEKWEKLHTYIFRRLAAGAVEDDANQQLGERKAEFRTVGTAAKMDVPEGALVTATPHIDGFQFNPPSVSLGFYKDWHRFDFELRAKTAPLNQSTNGAITFTVEGIIVADIPLSIFVGSTVSSAEVRTSAQVKLYHAIFCSYSHRDTQIVARAERAYKALGLDYLRDVISLKSGQEWDDELLNLISRADIFQLFWSNTAAESPYVRQEWEYALKLGRDKFIRPVYWEEPKPSIPPELGHIHFAYQPDLDD
jgi:hypothetical protein